MKNLLLAAENFVQWDVFHVILASWTNKLLQNDKEGLMRMVHTLLLMGELIDTVCTISRYLQQK